MAGASCDHDGHNAAPAVDLDHASGRYPSVTQPVQVVLDNYFQVQSSLVQNSIAGINKATEAMAKAIRADAATKLSPKVAEQIETLGSARDLASARDAFKAVSESLVGYLKEHKIGGFYVAYCPMAKASWLQNQKTVVINPYMGKDMIHCGQIKS
jgi:hypothetical protein